MSTVTEPRVPIPTPDAAALSGLIARVELALARALPPPEEDPPRLHEAMRYACQGGKRLRALLTYSAGQVLGLDLAALDAPAAAVELVHAYSLVHDDLPAMDDDDLRRGRPTVHKAFDEATAILVGDALLTQAFAILAAGAVGSASVSPQRQLRMVGILARAAGSLGMVGGQALDMQSEQQRVPLAVLESLHARKTGALIRAALLLAAAAAGAPPGEEQALSEFGRLLGLAYQVHDDVLDETASTALLGKTAGKDRVQAKSTYPALMGLEEARALAARTFAAARDSLAVFGSRAQPLLALAATIEGRDH